MAVNEKVLKALESASNYLKNSILALKRGDETLFSRSVWHVAAELEYALFLFLLTLGNGREKFKLNPESKNIQLNSLLSEAEALICDAKKSINNGDLLNAYKNTYMVRQHVFKIQENLAKKKRETAKKK
ncbi:hypothetical protein KEJ45_00730 [Candidatus Bathyarchaeota archaeon]|nr:hypothetical protein [Candidatus Bathyarchaeota archaeon]